jgi:hypothetical protein
MWRTYTTIFAKGESENVYQASWKEKWGLRGATPEDGQKKNPAKERGSLGWVRS